MAGYSGTPLVKKLGIKPGHRVAALDAPAGFDRTLGPIPAETRFGSALGRSRHDVILVFTKSESKMVVGMKKAAERLESNGGLWICWPKKSSSVVTDVTEDVVRKHALGLGLVDNKVCAVDDVWSGLRIVYRVADRARIDAERGAGRTKASQKATSSKKKPRKKK